MINYCYSIGHLSASQRSGVITLLYKPGDRLDYKIAAKAIANRLLQFLQFLIYTDQSCSVPGWNLIHNVRFLKDIVSDINPRGIGGAILSLDQEKAFDRVERMNFGTSFRQWVALFYSSIVSCVLGNGVQSHFFSVTRGVRQGCPLSPLLYVIIAETLANAIGENSLIDGFPLPSTCHVKTCQYADDTSIIVMSDAALKEVFTVFDRGIICFFACVLSGI